MEKRIFLWAILQCKQYAIVVKRTEKLMLPFEFKSLRLLECFKILKTEESFLGNALRQSLKSDDLFSGKQQKFQGIALSFILHPHPSSSTNKPFVNVEQSFILLSNTDFFFCSLSSLEKPQEILKYQFLWRASVADWKQSLFIAQLTKSLIEKKNCQNHFNHCQFFFFYFNSRTRHFRSTFPWWRLERTRLSFVKEQPDDGFERRWGVWGEFRIQSSFDIPSGISKSD